MNKPSITTKDVREIVEPEAYVLIQMSSDQSNCWRLIHFIEVFQMAAILKSFLEKIASTLIDWHCVKYRNST